jgi:hypothetical protein
MTSHTLPATLATPHAIRSTRSARAHKLIEKLAGRLSDLPAFELQLPGKLAQVVGRGLPTFRVAIHNDTGLIAAVSGDETSIAGSPWLERHEDA